MRQIGGPAAAKSGVQRTAAEQTEPAAPRSTPLRPFVDALPYGAIVSRTYDPTKPQILTANRARAERIELGGRPVLWDE